jgi:hypothetical protein
MAPMTRFTFRVDRQLGNALMAYCQSEDQKPSQVARRGIRLVIPAKFFKSNTEQTTKRRAPRKAGK